MQNENWTLEIISSGKRYLFKGVSLRSNRFTVPNCRRGRRGPLGRPRERFRKAMGSTFERPWAVLSKGHGQYIIADHRYERSSSEAMDSMLAMPWTLCQKAMGSMFERPFVGLYTTWRRARPLFRLFTDHRDKGSSL